MAELIDKSLAALRWLTDEATDMDREYIRLTLEASGHAERFRYALAAHDEAADLIATMQAREAELVAEAARLREGLGPMLGLVAYVTGLDDDLRWTPEFTRYVNGRFNEIATAIRSASDERG